MDESPKIQTMPGGFPWGECLYRSMSSVMESLSWSSIAYNIPIITFFFSLFFAFRLWQHFKRKENATYLLWWFLGVLTYAVGTFTEAFHGLWGWNLINFKAWYISGALLGGAPLAQGTVYLLLNRRSAHSLSVLLILMVVVAAICVGLSPVDPQAHVVNRLTGSVLSWQWSRYFSPFINSYALIFLVGGALYSAYKYFKANHRRGKFIGNIWIAVGALLPGIGGTFTRFGYEEVLFVTELVGILLIYRGYILMRDDSSPSVHPSQKERT